MNFLKDIPAICLVVPERWEYFQDYIKPTFKKRLGINVLPFLALKTNKVVPCGFNGNFVEDTDDLPPIYPTSTNYPTWLNKPNAFNAWKAHRTMLSYAKYNEWEKVLFLEDDVVIEDDFEKIALEIDKELCFATEYKFDDPELFYLGSYNASKESYPWDLDSYLLGLEGEIGGWHAIIINHKIYSKLINQLPIGPYDWICGKLIKKHIFTNCWAVSPSIITQKSGMSFIEGCNLEKPSRYD